MRPELRPKFPGLTEAAPWALPPGTAVGLVAVAASEALPPATAVGIVVGSAPEAWPPGTAVVLAVSWDEIRLPGSPA